MRLAIVFLLISATAGAATFDEGMALKRQEKIAEAEKVFAAVVAATPDDVAALEQWATVLGWLGRFDDSIVAWRRALDHRPDDPKLGMGLARVQYWKGDHAAARARLSNILAATPDDRDALALRGDVCAAQHDVSCARADYEHARGLGPSPELDGKLARLADAAEPARWRFDMGGQLDGFVTGDRSAEGSYFVQLSWQALDPLVISAGYEELHQFGKIDERLNLGAYLHPLAPLLVHGRVAVSPSASTIAPWEASGDLELRVGGPVTALGGVRYLAFDNQKVTITGVGARLDLGQVSLMAQGGLVFNTANDLTGFATGRAEVAVTDAWHVYAGVADGNQTQLLLPPANALDITSGVTWQIDPRWGLRLDLTYEKYGDIYTRTSAGTALTFKL